MGQAFDRDGNVLGDAYGETKRDVFEQLMKAHADAAEIRIRSLASEPSDNQSTSAELPRYRCHKEVWALKIASIFRDHPACVLPGAAMLTPDDTRYAPFIVRKAYMDKHDPQPGGYYVVYKDGYTSYSPPEAFEDGYTRL